MLLEINHLRIVFFLSFLFCGSNLELLPVVGLAGDSDLAGLRGSFMSSLVPGQTRRQPVGYS
jgi:hypothetical protein